MRSSKVPITIDNPTKRLSVTSCVDRLRIPLTANLSGTRMSNYPHAVGNFSGPGCVLLIRWLGGIETPRLNVTRGPHAPPRRRGGMILREIHMRMLLDIVRQSLSTLWAHKVRSFLTMFDIAWGVGSLLLLVGLGEGFRSGNRKQFDEIGENVMFIWGGRAPAMNGSFTSLRWYFLTYRDFEEVARTT